MNQERVTLSQKELKRIKAISALCSGNMSNSDAAATLGICLRQVIRLKKKYTLLGDVGLIHGNRNKQSKHRIRDDIRADVLRLFQEKYYDFNFSHFTDLLNEKEDISISRASVARILAAAGVVSKKHVKRRPKLHRGRPRKAAAGMLWQTDATKYEWFGKGNGYVTLHAYIDDATNVVVGAFFTENECMHGYAEALRRGVERYGLPMEIYRDRHTIFRSTKKLSEDEFAEGKTAPLSDFGEGLAELGIAQIFALSPEAKGRIERLWGTLQDRLAAEMRLMGITNIEAANKALSKLLVKHNRKFSVKAPEKPVYVPLLQKLDFDLLFSHRGTRRTDHGGTISYKGSYYRPADDCFGVDLKRKEFEVRETYCGKLYLVWDDRFIEMSKMDKQESVSKTQDAIRKAPAKSKAHKPAPNHPWKRPISKSPKTYAHTSTQAAS